MLELRHYFIALTAPSLTGHVVKKAYSELKPELTPDSCLFATSCKWLALLSLNSICNRDNASAFFYTKQGNVCKVPGS